MVATNAHVVDGCRRVKVEWISGPLIAGCFAELIAIDYTSDLALLRPEVPFSSSVVTTSIPGTENATDHQAALEKFISTRPPSRLEVADAADPGMRSESSGIPTGSRRRESPTRWSAATTYSMRSVSKYPPSCWMAALTRAIAVAQYATYPRES